MHSITTQLKKAEHEVYIFTPVIDDYTIVRSLKKTAKSAVKITLITNEAIPQEKNKDSLQNHSSYLALFQNISLFTLPSFHHDQDSSSALNGSLICIDDSEFFIITQALSSKQLKSAYAFALHQKISCNTLFEPLLERAKPY